MLLNPHTIRFGAIAVILVSAIAAQAQTPAPTGAAVYFINLKNHATVTSPLKFGLTGMGIAPAGRDGENRASSSPDRYQTVR
jgi:hypothetical protein